MAKTVELQAAWQGQLTGGCLVNPLWWQNPQFVLRPSCDADFKIELSPLDDTLSVGIIILHGDAGAITKGPAGNVMKQTQYKVTRVQSLSIRLSTLPKGSCYFVVPTTHKKGCPSPFTIKVSSDGDHSFVFESQPDVVKAPAPQTELNVSSSLRLNSDILLQSKAYVTGQAYEGGWKNGKYHGEGSFFFADGQAYLGEWRDGQKHGHGTLRTADGDLLRGIWSNGQIEQLWPVRSPQFIAYTEGVFNCADVNGDGQASMRELRGLLASLGLRSSVGSATQVMRAFDENADGYLSIAEFTEFVRQLCEHKFATMEAQQAAAGFCPSPSKLAAKKGGK